MKKCLLALMSLMTVSFGLHARVAENIQFYLDNITNETNMHLVVSVQKYQPEDDSKSIEYVEFFILSDKEKRAGNFHIERKNKPFMILDDEEEKEYSELDTSSYTVGHVRNFKTNKILAYINIQPMRGGGGFSIRLGKTPYERMPEREGISYIDKIWAHGFKADRTYDIKLDLIFKGDNLEESEVGWTGVEHQ